MNFLTFFEYQDFALTQIFEEDFQRLQLRATTQLNRATNFFYLNNDLETDLEFRKQAFKLALALQIEYMFKTGNETAEDKAEDNKISSQSIGSTTISFKTDNDKQTNAQKANNLCLDALNALSGTGLLYRGINAL